MEIAKILQPDAFFRKKFISICFVCCCFCINLFVCLFGKCEWDRPWVERKRLPSWQKKNEKCVRACAWVRDKEGEREANLVWLKASVCERKRKRKWRREKECVRENFLMRDLYLFFPLRDEMKGQICPSAKHRRWNRFNTCQTLTSFLNNELMKVMKTCWNNVSGSFITNKNWSFVATKNFQMKIITFFSLAVDNLSLNCVNNWLRLGDEYVAISMLNLSVTNWIVWIFNTFYGIDYF